MGVEVNPPLAVDAVDLKGDAFDEAGDGRRRFATLRGKLNQSPERAALMRQLRAQLAFHADAHGVPPGMARNVPSANE